MEDELGGRIMKKIVAARSKMYINSTDDDHVDKKTKGTRKCLIKQEVKF